MDLLIPGIVYKRNLTICDRSCLKFPIPSHWFSNLTYVFFKPSFVIFICLLFLSIFIPYNIGNNTAFLLSNKKFGVLLRPLSLFRVKWRDEYKISTFPRHNLNSKYFCEQQQATGGVTVGWAPLQQYGLSWGKVVLHLWTCEPRIQVIYFFQNTIVGQA